MTALSEFFVDPRFAGVPLTGGKIALIDACDWPAIGNSGYKWRAFFNNGGWYATRHDPKPGGGYRSVYMARQIMGEPKGIVDHQSGFTLDNRRDNLRAATTAQNNQNRRKPKNGVSSQYKGVCWKPRIKRWIAQINIASKRAHLGTFTNEVEAARAYDAAALATYGEFARTNFGSLAA